MSDTGNKSVVVVLAAVLAVPLVGLATMIALGMVGVSVAYWEGVILGLLARFVLVAGGGRPE